MTSSERRGLFLNLLFALYALLGSDKVIEGREPPVNKGSSAAICRSFVLDPRPSTFEACRQRINVLRNLRNWEMVSNEIYRDFVEVEQFKYFKKLKRMIEEGNPLAMEIGFELLPAMDGEFAEGLNIAFGRALKVSPAEFLSLLEKHSQWFDQAPARLESLLLSFGEEFVDTAPAKRQEEAARRARILQGVTNQKLSRVRDRCLGILNSP